MKIFFIILIIIWLLIILNGGENGVSHDCKHCNSCPASIRCFNEKEKECFEPGYKKMVREEKLDQIVSSIIGALVYCGIFLCLLSLLLIDFINK